MNGTGGRRVEEGVDRGKVRERDGLDYSGEGLEVRPNTQSTPKIISGEVNKGEEEGVMKIKES